MCIDQWSEEWSEQTCRQLGYSGQASTSSRYDFTHSDSEFWYRDVAVPVSGNPVQKAAASEGRCRSKETVLLACEEFGKPADIYYDQIFCNPGISLNNINSVCGSWNLTDSVASLLVGGEADLESGAQWPSLAVLFNVKRKASCTVTIFSPRWMVTSLTCVR